jgi:transcriptional regulator with XRE-family HTH domain
MAPRRLGGTVAPSAKSIARRIRQIRERLGMSKVAFARRLNIGRNTLIHYERGRGIPRSTILARIARTGGVSVDWLLTGLTADENFRSSDWEHALQQLQLVWRHPSQRPLILALLTAVTQNEEDPRAPSGRHGTGFSTAPNHSRPSQGRRPTRRSPGRPPRHRASA